MAKIKIAISLSRIIVRNYGSQEKLTDSRHHFSYINDKHEYSKLSQLGWVVRRVNYRSNYVIHQIRKD